MSTYILASPEQVLTYWFGDIGREEKESVMYFESRMGIWFGSKSVEFDALQKLNKDLLLMVSNPNLADEQWLTPGGLLARVLLLDQFPRCIYRGTPEAFRFDELTAQLVIQAIDKNWISSYLPIE